MFGQGRAGQSQHTLSAGAPSIQTSESQFTAAWNLNESQLRSAILQIWTKLRIMACNPANKTSNKSNKTSMAKRPKPINTLKSASNKQMAKIYLTNQKKAICSHRILMQFWVSTDFRGLVVPHVGPCVGIWESEDLQS